MTPPTVNFLTLHMKDYLITQFAEDVLITSKNGFFLVYNHDNGYWDLDMDENIINTMIQDYMSSHTYRTVGQSQFEIVAVENVNSFNLRNLITRDGWYTNVIALYKRELRSHSRNTMIDLDSLPAHSKISNEKENIILINLKNGVLSYNIDTTETNLVEHDKNYYFTGRIEIDYSPIETCDTWDSFMKSVVAKEEDINWLYLFLTYCLFSHDYGWEVGLYLYGEGANGKSTLAKAFRNMFSHPRFTSISALEKNFGLMGLIGGNFWWANESDNKTIKTDDLKRIISGEPVEIDIKHQKPETHHFKMKVMITANELPLLKKEADTRRFLIIPFPHSFEGERRDVELSDKLEKELPGLLNKLIYYIPTFIESRPMLSAGISENYKKQYEILSDPFKVFVEQFVAETDDSNDKISTLELTMAFNAWAYKNNHNTYTTQVVGRRIKTMFKNTKSALMYIDKKVGLQYTEGVLHPNYKTEKTRTRGFTRLLLDIGEIIKIDPQWDYEEINNFHLGGAGLQKIEHAKSVNRYQFINKVHALSEGGITLTEVFSAGEKDGFSKNEINEFIKNMIRDNKIYQRPDGIFKYKED